MGSLGQGLVLQDVSSGEKAIDTLHTHSNSNFGCKHSCIGSLMNPEDGGPSKRKTTKEIVQQAKDFLDQFYRDKDKSDSAEHLSRWKEIEKSISETGTYIQSKDELQFGVSMAWRNAARCVGRIQWRNIHVMDARHVESASDMFDSICKHLEYASNGGNIRTTITVFPPRKGSGHNDFRVWNIQLVRYAAYRNMDGSILGDPSNLEFTQLCESLGWKGKRTAFDVLPLVLQANGEDPEIFNIPSHLALEVQLIHPEYDWFADMGLRWYAVPAVSSMMLDCGGLQYTAAPFNGWYMGTEIGARDLCDTFRYNITQMVGEKMGLDVSSDVSLWKDRVLVEVNRAVLFSYQKAGVTIIDHHTCTEQFMSHFKKEVATRGGTPADWVWIVPPMSGSLCPVFHQEMANYKLKPSFEYMPDPWLSYKPKNKRQKGERTLSFKTISRMVITMVKMYRKAYLKRPLCTILYATETGTSQKYAEQTEELFDYGFRTKLVCMNDYNCSDLTTASLLLVVTSTFGSGEPPNNGTEFHGALQKMHERHYLTAQGKSILLESMKYSVLALGNSSYPQFCAFGKQVDRWLKELGATQLHSCVTADELGGQDGSANQWKRSVYKASCRSSQIEGKATLPSKSNSQSCEIKYRVVESNEKPSTTWSSVHKTDVRYGTFSGRELVTSKSKFANIINIKLRVSKKLEYDAGDKILVYPSNADTKVRWVLNRLRNQTLDTKHVRLETQTKDGAWQSSIRFPGTFNIQQVLTHFIDLNVCPSMDLLKRLSAFASSEEDRNALQDLSLDEDKYKLWISEYGPDIQTLLEQCQTLSPTAAFVLSEWPLIKPREYSITTIPAMTRKTGSAEVLVGLQRVPQQESLAQKYGLCSTWMGGMPLGSPIPYRIQRDANFRLPESKCPITMACIGTGIAAMRPFWLQRSCEAQKGYNNNARMVLYFGCQSENEMTYAKEMKAMKKKRILTSYYVAFSKKKKCHVQDLMLKNSYEVYKDLIEDRGHLYVSGTSRFADEVQLIMQAILCSHGQMSEVDSVKMLEVLKVNKRYHIDVQHK